MPTPRHASKVKDQNHISITNNKVNLNLNHKYFIFSSLHCNFIKILNFKS